VKTTEGIPLDFRTCSVPSIKTEREGVFQNGSPEAQEAAATPGRFAARSRAAR
jgi:hypothetical protein